MKNTAVRGVAMAGLVVMVAGCGSTSKPMAKPTLTPITTVSAATTALEAKLPGWSVSVVALPAAGFEAAAYDTTGQIDRWTYRGAAWTRTARARYPFSANGEIPGPAQHLYPNAAPTAITGGIVTGMQHATFVLAMSGWSDSVSSIGNADLIYTTDSHGVFSTVHFEGDAAGDMFLLPAVVDPESLTSLALESPYASISNGVLLTPDSQAAKWTWNGTAFTAMQTTSSPTPTPKPPPSAAQAPCSNWGLPPGSKVMEVLYCQGGWAVLDYLAPGVPARETFRAHWIHGSWQHADNLCMNPTPAVPKSWVTACRVG